MSDDKPGLIMKWINSATHEQISHATNYIQRKGLELPHASTYQQSLISLFINEPAQGNPYPLERWVTFQKMTAHCRQKKHKLHSGKVQLSASINRESKEKLELIAKERDSTQSETIDLIINFAWEYKGKLKSKSSAEKRKKTRKDKLTSSTSNDDNSSIIAGHYRALQDAHHHLISIIHESMPTLEKTFNNESLSNDNQQELKVIIDKLKNKAPLI